MTTNADDDDAVDDQSQFRHLSPIRRERIRFAVFQAWLSARLFSRADDPIPRRDWRPGDDERDGL